MIFADTLTNAIELIRVSMLVLTACGCFLVGINLMTKGFVLLCQNQNSVFLKLFRSKNRFTGILSGILYSGLTQSSDSASVFAIRLTDIGAITLFQACCAIIGANIGTTITNFMVSMTAFNIAPYLAFAAFVGAIPLLIGKGGFKTFGEIVSGFGVMFIGIQLLELYSRDAVFTSAIQAIFEACSSPYILLIAGLVITSIVQSSSVVTSLVIFFVGSAVSLEGAFFVVAGANIGTCVTSSIASLRSSLNGKRVSMFHFMFNIIAVALFIVVMHFFETEFMTFAESLNIDAKFKVALFSLAFNLSTAIIILPFIRPMAWFTTKLLRNK